MYGIRYTCSELMLPGKSYRSENNEFISFMIIQSPKVSSSGSQIKVCI